jgi:hypothetical protein
MIRVRVVTGVVALTGSVSGCAVQQGGHEDVEVGEDAFSVADPGRGVFKMGWAYGSATGFGFQLTDSTTDEYVRVGESMSFCIPGNYLWDRLHPTEALPGDVERVRQLQATVKAVYLRNGSPIGTSTVVTDAWTGDQPWNMSATTPSFTVHRRADAIRFEVVIADAVDAAAQAVIGQAELPEVYVLGADVPNKTVLFDNFGSEMRHRVLEGGLPVRGAELAIAYTDWRAQKLVDASSIDRQIGTQTSFSRFGAIEVPVFGDVEYEISYGVGLDDAWQQEQALTANASSRLLPTRSRTAWEGTLSVPTGTQGLHLYFHVKAFLKADYSKVSNVKWKKFADGERILVRERWDNENAAPGDNWDLATETR